jgi:hypothetical protein
MGYSHQIESHTFAAWGKLTGWPSSAVVFHGLGVYSNRLNLPVLNVVWNRHVEEKYKDG